MPPTPPLEPRPPCSGGVTATTVSSVTGDVLTVVWLLALGVLVVLTAMSLADLLQ